MWCRSLLLAVALISASAWGGVLDKVILPGEVIAGHAKYELECERCHAKFDKSAQSRLCLDCHKETDKDVLGKTGLHGHFADKICAECHTDHKGRKARIAEFDKQTFDHGKTDYKLNGTHQKAKCEGCHSPKLKYRQAPHLCNDCHKRDDFAKGHKGLLGTKCESCHNEVDWKETVFDHEKTRFRLLNKHKDVKCKACHLDKTYKNAPLTCVGCHQKDDKAKGHKGRYGNKCETCHNDRGWKEIRFDHDVDTKYALKGKHREAKCDSCHLPEKGAIYQKQKLASTCIACHKKIDQEKGHRGKLGEKCDSCHSERDWKTTRFDHEKTKFPLRDKHRDAKCEACHTGGVSGQKANIKVELTCVGCHKKQDDDKGHKGRYGNKCETCHTAKDWKADMFNHDRDTKYLLKHKHKEVKCDACHLPMQGNIYQHKLDAQCLSCHKKDDKHNGQLGKKCESCHDEKRWQGVPYDHNKSRYPLTGSHARTPCKKCHATPAYRDVALTCFGCHEPQDKHKRRYGTKCESCHYTGTWKSWDYDHGKTRFALDGAHKKLVCEDCHTEATTSPLLGRACISCHEREDIHDGGFGRQCERCHVSSDWKKYRR